jgi:hypothetical protein
MGTGCEPWSEARYIVVSQSNQVHGTGMNRKLIITEWLAQSSGDYWAIPLHHIESKSAHWWTHYTNVAPDCWIFSRIYFFRSSICMEILISASIDLEPGLLVLHLLLATTMSMVLTQVWSLI